LVGTTPSAWVRFVASQSAEPTAETYFATKRGLNLFLSLKIISAVL
jgi:hypothetical protein